MSSSSTKNSPKALKGKTLKYIARTIYNWVLQGTHYRFLEVK